MTKGRHERAHAPESNFTHRALESERSFAAPETAEKHFAVIGFKKVLKQHLHFGAVSEVFGAQDYAPAPSGKYRFGDTRHICSDVSKLKDLGWKPTRSIYDSVEAYKGWLSTADNAGDILDYCNRQMQQLNVVREVVKY